MIGNKDIKIAAWMIYRSHFGRICGFGLSFAVDYDGNYPCYSIIIFKGTVLDHL